MIYEILMTGEQYSLHLSHAEAEKYAQDLRKVYPLDDIEVIPRRVGRLTGQEAMIWGGECILQLDELPEIRLHQWAKIYLWRSQARAIYVPKIGDFVPLYLTIYFSHTEESVAVREVRQAYRDVVFEKVNAELFKRVK